MSVSIFQIAVLIEQRETEGMKQTIRTGCTYVELLVVMREVLVCRYLKRPEGALEDTLSWC